MSDAFAAHAGRLAGMTGAVLGWSPDTFWCATPAELAAVVAALTPDTAAATPPDAATLARLQQEFPDG